MKKKSSIINRVIEGVFSFPCPGCRAELPIGEKNFFCGECLARLRLFRPPFCPDCGGELDGVLERCGECLKLAPRAWERGMAVMEMTGYARILVHRLKYRNVPELARAFGVLLAARLEAAEISADMIVPMPLHWRRAWQRGYNQAELLGRALSEQTDVPLKRILTRSRATRKQASLTRNERLENLAGAFSVKEGEICGNRSILLIDDVMTTGATLGEAAAVLRDAGAEKVNVIVLAKRS